MQTPNAPRRQVRRSDGLVPWRAGENNWPDRARHGKNAVGFLTIWRDMLRHVPLISDATERVPPLQIGVSQKRPTIIAMEKRRLGKTDMDVSVLGFGGSEIGYEHAAPETVAELLNSALDAGLNVIDTAECYYNSEELVGQAVSNRRKEFYLFTKCGHPHGMESGANWSRDSILKSIERSLERLKTDRLDLVQLHSCSESTLRKGEVIDALQTARERGHTR